MKCRLISSLIAGFILFPAMHSLLPPVYAEEESPVIVSAIVDRDSINIGDKITYIIEAKAGRDIEVELPQFGENLEDFTIRDFGSSEGGLFGKRRFSRWYQLDIYESGTYTIPEAVVRYRQKGEEEWKELKTNEVTVEVKSLLQTQDESSDIRDIKGPVGANIDIKQYILWGVVMLALISVIAAIVIFMRKRDKEVSPPVRPAHEIAYEALEALKSKGCEIEEYYVELSHIVRRYLENRFGLRAPEMTTEEFLNRVKDGKTLSGEHTGLLRDFLSHCDLVKFARYQPLQTEMEMSLESARRLIEQTREEMPKVS